MPRPAPSPITIAQIKALPEAAEGERTWVNGVITATVVEIKPFPNKEASIIKFQDSTGTIQANFWGRTATFMQQYSGNTIKITGQGISRGRREYNGAVTLSVNIPDKASIQIVGDSSPSQGAATQGRAVSVQSGGPQAGLDQSPVRERVHCYFEVLKEVSAQYKHLQSTLEEGALPKLTASDIKDITTSISLSYRGEFGSYAKPIFQKPQQDKEDQHPQDEQVDPESDDLPF